VDGSSDTFAVAEADITDDAPVRSLLPAAEDVFGAPPS